jgi:hypothetical protein
MSSVISVFTGMLIEVGGGGGGAKVSLVEGSLPQSGNPEDPEGENFSSMRSI